MAWRAAGRDFGNQPAVATAGSALSGAPDTLPLEAEAPPSMPRDDELDADRRSRPCRGVPSSPRRAQWRRWPRRAPAPRALHRARKTPNEDPLHTATDPTTLSLAALAAGLRSGKLSSEEVDPRAFRQDRARQSQKECGGRAAPRRGTRRSTVRRPTLAGETTRAPRRPDHHQGFARHRRDDLHRRHQGTRRLRCRAKTRRSCAASRRLRA